MFRILSGLLALFLVGLPCWGSAQFEIQSVAQFIKSYSIEAEFYEPKDILVVLDIDNTLLTMQGELGSDQWWNWQEGIVFGSYDDAEKISLGATATNFGDLLKVQGYLFDMLPMRSVEYEAVTFISALQGIGVPVMGLTSRGPEFMNAAFRELYQADYDMRKTASKDEAGDYRASIPYRVSDLETKYGFSKKQISDYKLSRPRPALYRNGVYFTSGQHKGAMLHMFLKDRSISPKIIFFVDDHKKNTDRLWSAFRGLAGRKRVDLFTYRYGHLDQRVQAFKKSNKKTVQDLWQSIYRPDFEQGIIPLLKGTSDEKNSFIYNPFM